MILQGLSNAAHPATRIHAILFVAMMVGRAHPAAFADEPGTKAEVLAFRGLCDASAIVALDAEHVVSPTMRRTSCGSTRYARPKRLRRY